MGLQVKNTSPLVRGLLGKPKVKPRELMPLRRVVVSSHALNFAMLIESLSVERRSCDPQRCSQK